MATETVETGRVAFPCECRGCRGRDADLASVWQWQQIPGRVAGHYFDPDTRRFFRSRILSWRHLDRGALAVRESSAGDMDNTWRAHRVVVFCRFGELVERYPVAVGEPWRTGAAAARFMAALPGDAAAGCGCHGCTLDRNGRGQA
jgi:hypothetical protein